MEKKAGFSVVKAGVGDANAARQLRDEQSEVKGDVAGHTVGIVSETDMGHMASSSSGSDHREAVVESKVPLSSRESGLVAVECSRSPFGEVFVSQKSFDKINKKKSELLRKKERLESELSKLLLSTDTSLNKQKMKLINKLDYVKEKIKRVDQEVENDPELRKLYLKSLEAEKQPKAAWWDDSTSTTPRLDISKSRLKFLENTMKTGDAAAIGSACVEVLERFHYFVDEDAKKIRIQDSKEMQLFVRFRRLLQQAVGNLVKDRLLKKYNEQVMDVMDVINNSFRMKFCFSNLVPFMGGVEQYVVEDNSEDAVSIADKLLELCLSAASAVKESEGMVPDLKMNYKRNLFLWYRSLSALRSSDIHAGMIDMLLHLTEEGEGSFWFELIYVVLRCRDTIDSDKQQAVLRALKAYDSDAERMMQVYFANAPQKPLEAQTKNYRLVFMQAWICAENGDEQVAVELIEKAEKIIDEECLIVDAKEFDAECIRILLMGNNDRDGLNKLKDRVRKLLLSDYNTWWVDDRKRLQACYFKIIRRLSASEVSKWALDVASERYSDDDSDDDLAPDEAEQTLSIEKDSLPKKNDSPIEVIKGILKLLKARQRTNMPESLEPDDTYRVVASGGRSVDSQTALKKENWNSDVHKIIEEVKGCRASGDMMKELSYYKDLFSDPRRKNVLGRHVVLLELVWTINRYVLGEHGDHGLSNNKKRHLLNLASEIVQVAVENAMQRSSAFPEGMEIDDLMELVCGWLTNLNDEALKREMEFFMRCALGSTMGHIYSIYCELFPDRTGEKSEYAHYCFQMKKRLQPGYKKKVAEESEERAHITKETFFDYFESEMKVLSTRK